MTRNFRDLVERRWADGKFLCVGLDPDPEKLPEPHRSLYQQGCKDEIHAFLLHIIEATVDFAAAFKPNYAFFEGLQDGEHELQYTMEHLRRYAPHVPVILDAKRGDIGNTNFGSVRYAFDRLRADAITVNPYLGGESLQPFLNQKDKGVFVLVRTSNPGSDEFQSQLIGSEPLYFYVARRFATHWNRHQNCGFVAGAPKLDELRRLREAFPQIPILVPGVGVQGGSIPEVLAHTWTPKLNHPSILINASRTILYASAEKDFKDAAHNQALVYQREIETYRQSLTQR